jgi:hypothetical protein
LRALRVSAGCNGGEWVPVGSAGVEQDSDPEVAEAGEPERRSLHPFDEIVGGLCGGVGVMRLVPGGDLVAPADQGAAQRVDLDWTRVVLEVMAETGNELERAGPAVKDTDDLAVGSPDDPGRGVP